MYVRIYQDGKDRRFVDPRVSFSHRARLTFRSKSHVAQYLLNYILRDPSYAELKRNCQTFAGALNQTLFLLSLVGKVQSKILSTNFLGYFIADLCAFIAGKKEVLPFHPVSRIDYQNRTYLFLYDSHMYENRRFSRV